MGAEYSPDMVWRAQEMYCADCLSFAKIATETGVTATTLKAWSKKFGWRAKREELARIESEIRMDTVRSRKKALSMLLEAQDGKECSQMAFAVSSLENLAIKQQELILAGKIAERKEHQGKVEITNRADAVTSLTSAVEGRLYFALQNPEAISSATVADIVKMLNLMDELKASLPKDDEVKEKAKQGISKELAENIRKALNIEN